MGIIHGQEAVTSMEWVIRAIIAFSVLLLLTKALGQRTISQIRPLDFAMALVVGNIIAHPLSDERLGLKGSIITTTVLVILYFGGMFATLKWPWFRRLITPPPISVVQDGKIIYKGLKKAKISIDVLLEELRGEKVEDVSKVALAIWEADGKLSVFLDSKHQPLTPLSIQLKTQPFELPKTIIKEGVIHAHELTLSQKSEDWLIHQLESLYGTNVKNVLLATLDNQDNLKVFLYKD